MNSVHQQYKKIELKDHFNLTLITEKKVLEIVKCIDISKATGISNFSEISKRWFKPIAEICNISISPGLFPSDCKIAKLKTLYKTTIDIKGY